MSYLLDANHLCNWKINLLLWTDTDNAYNMAMCNGSIAQDPVVTGKVVKYLTLVAFSSLVSYKC